MATSNIPSQAIAFRSIYDFQIGQVFSCDHKDEYINTSARANASSTGKKRPCLLVGIDDDGARLYLAPMSQSQNFNHPGWEKISDDPKITLQGATLIWVGRPAVVIPIYNNRNEMYWIPGAHNNEALMRRNLTNYNARREAFKTKWEASPQALAKLQAVEVSLGYNLRQPIAGGSQGPYPMATAWPASSQPFSPAAQGPNTLIKHYPQQQVPTYTHAPGPYAQAPAVYSPTYPYTSQPMAPIQQQQPHQQPWGQQQAQSNGPWQTADGQWYQRGLDGRLYRLGNGGIWHLAA
ncbi:hypothetical protein C8F04DRAFT_1392024 [Mycena alexandri]|uniref:Uncharacterized protein n=1 Tax=Mycena alexandri TaxID=1745969 RepID=A0AAD6XCC0_9AGAR|nr:hypothetical protein C8F04DRAFT_1392024 [Mycena alexandri]